MARKYFWVCPLCDTQNYPEDKACQACGATDVDMEDPDRHRDDGDPEPLGDWDYYEGNS
jgi:hypothetical protein